MKRRPHRKTKIQVGDQVYATTEILAHAGAPAIPLGARGEVLRVDGKVLDVKFEEPGVARVARGQVRPALAPEAGVPDWDPCESLHPGDKVQMPDGRIETIAAPGEEARAALSRLVQANEAAAQDTGIEVVSQTITINGVEVPAIAAKDIEP